MTRETPKRCSTDDVEFRRLLEELPAGAYTCDAEGLITYFNPQAEKLWGRAPNLNDPLDRFCGAVKVYAPDGTLMPPDESWMARALSHNDECTGHEVVIERPDGGRVTALAHVKPIRDEAGELVGAVNVLVDVSDRKRAEDVLKANDRSKDEFLAMLAHELRNPLASIRTAVHILYRTVPRCPQAESALGLVERQMRHMTRLIDDVLNIARITANKLDLRRERVALAEVLDAAVETSRPLVDTFGHELAVTPPPEPVYLDADPLRLAQALSNLLDNAAKYTERGGRIELGATRDGGDAVVTVRDTGVGIPAEMLPRIFELFTRVEPSLSRFRGGSGVGLTVVKRLVEMHRGTITARSDGPGTGSTFIVRLPLAAVVPLPS